MLIAGSNTDISELTPLLGNGDIAGARDFLKQQLWYSPSGDMEHLKNLWLRNFNEHPDFSPNYIVPNISSIIRCLSDNEGFSVVPDFLRHEALDAGKIKLVWEGNTPWENTMYKNELAQLKELFEEKREREVV